MSLIKVFNFLTYIVGQNINIQLGIYQRFSMNFRILTTLSVFSWLGINREQSSYSYFSLLHEYLLTSFRYFDFKYKEILYKEKCSFCITLSRKLMFQIIVMMLSAYYITIDAKTDISHGSVILSILSVVLLLIRPVSVVLRSEICILLF